MNKRIAIVYLSFHCEPYMDAVVKGLEGTRYPKELLELVIVDNPHPTHGSSVAYLEREVMPKSGATLPKVTILSQSTNLGFAGGNNVGIHYAIEHGFDYVFFLNNDAYTTEDAFTELIGAFEKDPKIGIAQSLILLEPEHDLINSSGNTVHFCGFGFCRDYRAHKKDRTFQDVEDIGYASGASLMVPTALCKEFGGWDHDFFLYHEDTEWSLRLRAHGYRVVLASKSAVHHAYEFKRSISKFYWMERNRYVILFLFLKWPTLVLIFPAVLVFEIGTWIMAFKGKWAGEKLKVYLYWLTPSTWSLWWKKRVAIQSLRTVDDKTLTNTWVGAIEYQEQDMQSTLLTNVVNPVMNWYWSVVRWMMVW